MYSLQRYKKRAAQATLFLFSGISQLKSTEATHLAHVELLNLNTGGNLEH